MTEQRKMPRLMKEVYKQIMEHPFYAQTDESFKFSLTFGANYSVRTRQNNKWARQIWSYMYASGARPESLEKWPERVPIDLAQPQ